MGCRGLSDHKEAQRFKLTIHPSLPQSPLSTSIPLTHIGNNHSFTHTSFCQNAQSLKKSTLIHLSIKEVVWYLNK